MIKNLFFEVKNKFKTDGFFALVGATLRYVFRYKEGSAYRKMLKLDSNKDRFDRIYQRNFWRSRESGSGEGSELAYTQNLRKFLLRIIQEHEIHSIVDAPCGDFNWMKEVLPRVDVKYYGFDIVDSVIKENKQQYSSEKIEFGVADICIDKLPDCDLLIVRDCLFHLSFEDIDRFLRNITDLEYKYLLTTSYFVEEDFVNEDVHTGDFRLINLFDKPFRFGNTTVMDRVDDYPEGYPIKREVVLFRKEDVPLSMDAPRE